MDDGLHIDNGLYIQNVRMHMSIVGLYLETGNRDNSAWVLHMHIHVLSIKLRFTYGPGTAEGGGGELCSQTLE